MSNKRILGAAVAAALFSLPVGIAQAGTFLNVNDVDHATDTTSPCQMDAETAAAATPIVTSIVDTQCVITDAKPLPAAGLPIDPSVFHANFDGLTAVVDVPNAVPPDDPGGIVYACEIFCGDGPPKLPKTNPAGVIYTIDSPVSVMTQVTYTLSDGVFAGSPQLGISDTASGYGALLTSIPTTNKVTFTVDAATNPLAVGDQLALTYFFTGAASLATGGPVDLSITIKNSTGVDLQAPGTVTIASCKPAISADIKPQTDGKVQISVEDKEKTFVGTPAAWVSSTTAEIGLLKLTNVDGADAVKESDGESDFDIGGGSEPLATPPVPPVLPVTTNDDFSDDPTLSTLVIDGGQFEASLASGVFLFGPNGLADIPATSLVGGKATFELTAQNLLDIENHNPAGSNGYVPIRMTVNGTDVINTVESPPTATLTITFEQDYVCPFIKGPSEILQIFRDGTVCWVYNVPTPEAQDNINIRLTNDSDIESTVVITMYEKSGAIVGGGAVILKPETDPLKAGETVKFSAQSLVDAGLTWTGRAVAKFLFTSPDIEMLAMLRNKAPGSPLTNLSVGASGSSCFSQ